MKDIAMMFVGSQWGGTLYTFLVDVFVISGGIVWEVTRNDTLQRRRNWSHVLLRSGVSMECNNGKLKSDSKIALGFWFPSCFILR